MKIYLSSYLNNNLGDDLMIKLICERYPNHDFFVSNTNNLYDVACKCSNLHIIKSITPCKNDVLRRMFNKFISYFNVPKIQIIKEFKSKKYDVNLELGGSIFMQVTPKSWINKIRDAEYIVNHCDYNMIVNSNFGPFFTTEFHAKHQELFKNYDIVIFRDLTSYKMFSCLNNVKCYPDIVFNIPFTHIKSCRKRVGISVISLNNKGIRDNKDKYITGIVSLIKAIRKKYEKYAIVLLSFCENEGDLDACKLIVDKGGFLQHEIEIFNHTDVEDSIRFFSDISAMVCTRFHANILAIALRIPFIPVIYSNKISDMLEDFGYVGYRWNIKEGDNISIEAAIELLNKTPDINYKKMEEAMGHLTLIDRVLA